MQVKARPARQPGLDLGVLVGAVVVTDQVHIQVGRDLRLDVTQEGEKFLVPMALLALGQDAAVGDVQGREQRRGAMAHIVVGDAFDAAQTHGQHRLGPLEGLHLALLINAQNQSMVWRIEVQADHIAHLLDEKRGRSTA